MSIRIHELAKRHNMEAKDMLALLKERGFVTADTKSVSSTLNKIYEEEIEKEFAAKVSPVVAVPPAPVEIPVAEPVAHKVPSVKSAQDVVREKEAAKVLTPPLPISPTPISAPKPAPMATVPAASPSAPRPVSVPQPLPPRPMATPAGRTMGGTGAGEAMGRGGSG